MVNRPRLNVLRRRADFLLIAKKGKRYSVEKWLVLNYIKTGTGQMRCGWTIPKQVGNSVIRNRLRRWCREIIREKWSSGGLQSFDINVFIRPVDPKFFRALEYSKFKDSLERGLSGLRV